MTVGAKVDARVRRFFVTSAKSLRTFGSKLDERDMIAATGCGIAWYGLDQLWRGLGPAVVGLALLAIAAFSR